MPTLTPEEISEILAQFFDVVGKRQYVGARYVPVFGRKDESSIQWDNTKPYEPLTIVLYQGNSFTSRTYVPIGVDINNTDYWANTGNYNAQVEQYRRENLEAIEQVEQYHGEVVEVTDDVNTLLNSKPINVLTLGFDNTGTNDISELFNTYNAQFPLYFPCGYYKVSHSLHVQNSVFGASRIRSRVSDDDSTCFISEINSTENGIFYIDVDKSISMQSFNVYCDANNSAIVIDNNYVTQKYSFFDITIANLYNVGIETKGSVFSSRLFDAKSISIFGALNAESTGFRTTFASGDCFIEDVEVIGCRYGFNFDGGIYNLNNVHVWCGYAGDATVINPNWWSTTRGILVAHSARVFGNNIYLDSCYLSISCTYIAGSYNIVSINNLEIIFDTSVQMSARKDASLFFMQNANDKILINSGYIRVNENDPVANVNAANVVIKNVIYRRDFSYDGTNRRKAMLNRAYVPIEYYISANGGQANTYAEIARIYHGADVTAGECYFNVLQGYGGFNANIAVQIRSGSVSANYESIIQGTAPSLYYRDDGTFVHIYALNATNQVYDYYIRSINYNNYVSLVDKASLQQTTDADFEILTDASTLTQISARN